MDGIDVAKVTGWFEANVPVVAPPLHFELIPGGRSNLTYKVTDAGGSSWVLRRPPLGHVLPTAHDMRREHRIITALGATPVPVPAAVGYCDDPHVNGQPFYVMGFVDGLVLRDVESAKALEPETRAAASASLVEVLVAIHAIDPPAVGLADLGRNDGYIERQLRRWYGQFQQSKLREVPAVDEMHDFLVAHIPDQQGTTIVHGDYRLDNCLLGTDGQVQAVLDWEICTLGDPLADLGLLLVYWNDPADSFSALGTGVTALPGFLHREELRALYEARSPRDLSALDFYVAFGYWKLACILDGVHTRYAMGAMGADGAAWESFGDSVVQLADAAKAMAERVG